MTDSTAEWLPSGPASSYSDEAIRATPLWKRMMAVTGLPDTTDIMCIARDAIDEMWKQLHPEFIPSGNPAPRLAVLRQMESLIMDEFDAPSCREVLAAVKQKFAELRQEWVG